MDPKIVAAIREITKQAYELKRKNTIPPPGVVIPAFDDLNGGQQTLEVDSTNYIIGQYDLLIRGLTPTVTDPVSTRENR